MSELLQEIQKKLVFPIDFASQRKTDQLVFRTLFFGTVTASLIGFFTQSLLNLIICFGVTFALCLVAVLPSYHAYNKQRPEWVKPKIRA
ncbi:LANO_0E15742g1_1 [Lachancea nothofagi CBS 11611]|uniref:LANO_0E15742g1_1 n=1 Tax=Lachancea nothofagi CBS 11611 TaxID=1266666 RepID=A0A1G4K1D0_9SACH|nr:LANO_0E15742g1_1 [Lachancea nothofagi CBS 11611]